MGRATGPNPAPLLDAAGAARFPSRFGVIRRAQSWEVVHGGSLSALLGQQLRTGSAQGQAPFLLGGLCSTLHIQDAPQNPTRIWVGKHLKGHLIPTFCHRHLPLSQAVQAHPPHLLSCLPAQKSIITPLPVINREKKKFCTRRIYFKKKEL